MTDLDSSLKYFNTWASLAFVNDSPNDDGGVGGGRDQVLVVVGENEGSDGGRVRLVLDELDRHRQRKLESADRPVTRANEQQPPRVADHDLSESRIFTCEMR